MLFPLCFPILEIHFLSLQPSQRRFSGEGKGQMPLREGGGGGGGDHIGTILSKKESS